MFKHTPTHTHTQPTDFQYHLLEVYSFSQLHNICLECPCYFLTRTIFPEHAFGDRCLEGQCSYSIIGVINSYPDPFLLLSLPPLSSPPPSPLFTPSLPSLPPIPLSSPASDLNLKILRDDSACPGACQVIQWCVCVGIAPNHSYWDVLYAIDFADTPCLCVQGEGVL